MQGAEYQFFVQFFTLVLSVLVVPAVAALWRRLYKLEQQLAECGELNVGLNTANAKLSAALEARNQNRRELIARVEHLERVLVAVLGKDNNAAAPILEDLIRYGGSSGAGSEDLYEHDTKSGPSSLGH